MTRQLTSAKDLCQITRLFTLIVHNKVSGTLVKLTIRFALSFLNTRIMDNGRDLMLPRQLRTMTVTDHFRNITSLILRIPNYVVRLFRFKTFNAFLSLYQIRIMFLFRFANSLLTTPVLRPIIRQSTTFIRPRTRSISVITISINVLMRRVELITVARLLRVLPYGIKGLLINRRIFQIQICKGVGCQLLNK